jgi:methyl-accepting chemotaxis protein
VETSLQAAVSQIEAGLATVGTALEDAVQATNEIAYVALQTRMVALNASIPAAQAGASCSGGLRDSVGAAPRRVRG